MKSKQKLKVVVWLIIPMFVLLTVHSFSGQMLCVGEDSHMQLESTVDSCCSIKVPQTKISHQIGDTQGHPGCGICSDVGLDQANSTRVFTRLVDLPELDLMVGPVWPVILAPSVISVGNLFSLEETQPSLTQQKLSVSIAILIC